MNRTVLSFVLVAAVVSVGLTSTPFKTLIRIADGAEPSTDGERSVRDVTVEFIDSTYQVASGNTSGFFHTGQNADIVLSAVDFNDAGGPLFFNHQAGIASDGTHLLLADSNNNRVLIWNTLPEGNVAPDLVLGQQNFITNNPGSGMDEMNWPVDVVTDGQHVVVADSYNHRILIWNSFPTESGVPADLVLQGGDSFRWPWGAWTDSEKLVITSTGSGTVLIWNQFPTQDNQPADMLLTGEGKMGTPRTITSDGDSLIIGDHNAKVEGQSDRGNFFWKTFPTSDDQPFDFYMSDPKESPWMQGDFTDDGKLVLFGSTVHIWNSFPGNENDSPDLSITGYDFDGGDHAGLVIAGGRVYISSGNSNKILVYNSIPTSAVQAPDFAIGSPDINTNTLETNFIISNPVPASDGQSLFVSSDFDRKLYVWKKLPDESGAYPDIVYSLDDAPWDNVLWGDTLALAGMRTVYIWKSLPMEGESPDLIFKDSIGSVQFQRLTAITIDDNYFYLGDQDANKVYVWEGIPSDSSEPVFELDVNVPWRAISDGTYLVVTMQEGGKVLVYQVEGLSSESVPISIGEASSSAEPQGSFGPIMFNLPAGAFLRNGHLFVADFGWSRVHVWENIEDALAGKFADVILGENGFDDVVPEIGRDKLFWSGTLFFDGSYLWVGEFKFSERLLRFSPS